MSSHTNFSPVRHASGQTTNTNGSWTGNVIAGLRYWVQPTTAGAFLSDNCVLTGTSLTVTFKKFKTNGLGITLGTLLSVQAFEDVTGAVSFNLFGSEDCN